MLASFSSHSLSFPVPITGPCRPGDSGATYDLERVGNNADSHELLAVVATVHHEGVGQALDDGALRLAEALGGIAASGVRKVDGVTDLDVVAVRAKSQVSKCVVARFESISGLSLRGVRYIPRFPSLVSFASIHQIVCPPLS